MRRRALNIERERSARRDPGGCNNGRMIVVGRDGTGYVGGRNLTWAGGFIAATLADRDDAAYRERSGEPRSGTDDPESGTRNLQRTRR